MVKELCCSGGGSPSDKPNDASNTNNSNDSEKDECCICLEPAVLQPGEPLIYCNDTTTNTLQKNIQHSILNICY